MNKKRKYSKKKQKRKPKNTGSNNLSLKLYVKS